jgi:hypothetical protein
MHVLLGLPDESNIKLEIMPKKFRSAQSHSAECHAQTFMMRGQHSIFNFLASLFSFATPDINFPKLWQPGACTIKHFKSHNGTTRFKNVNSEAISPAK